MHDLSHGIAVALALSLLTACGGSGSDKASASGEVAEAVTGKTIEIKMIGDDKGYRFEPKTVTIKVGDGLAFTNVTGGPHNVTFWFDSIPSGEQPALQGNMPNTIAPLTGPLLTNPNEAYTVSFAGAKPGTYKFYCTPHLALGMRGSLTVQ